MAYYARTYTVTTSKGLTSGLRAYRCDISITKKIWCRGYTKKQPSKPGSYAISASHLHLIISPIEIEIVQMLLSQLRKTNLAMPES
jgi:hypothetical protein